MYEIFLRSYEVARELFVPKKKPGRKKKMSSWMNINDENLRIFDSCTDLTFDLNLEESSSPADLKHRLERLDEGKAYGPDDVNFLNKKMSSELWDAIVQTLFQYNGFMIFIVGLISLISLFLSLIICCITCNSYSKYKRLDQKIHPMGQIECQNCKFNQQRMIIFTDSQTSKIQNGAYILVPFETTNQQVLYNNNRPILSNHTEPKEINNFEKDIPLNAATYLVEKASENQKTLPYPFNQ
ncbi:unnamed protein product [Brachionus calyciflorus]|uniref:Uncharacterized protein n=1 Tax=Brachionus calyciflorus TaxID=104777 RepID=A0A814AKR2_9BILA|nr:unnamed protein product [Brachionus calyciflorus]